MTNIPSILASLLSILVTWYVICPHRIPLTNADTLTEMMNDTIPMSVESNTGDMYITYPSGGGVASLIMSDVSIGIRSSALTLPLFIASAVPGPRIASDDRGSGDTTLAPRFSV